MRTLLTAAFLVLASATAFAVQPDEMLKDPALESRARSLSRDLRCMVCQNQSIDDSDAPLARDLRILVRERLSAGDSDKQVVDFLVSRYGDFVLLKPRFAWHTALLWMLPPGLLIAGAAALLALRRRGPQTAALGLTVDEERRVNRLLDGAQPKDTP
ncbi:MAG: cytochrome c-type biogenesis protein CcmH [Pseudolabrys sp.]|nr:cytochrome c-type biogenesis protein CcmH [Pseudolabrys sp.]